MQQMNLIASDSHKPAYKSAADQKLSKMNNKVDENETKIKQNELQVEFLKKKTIDSFPQNTIVNAPYA